MNLKKLSLVASVVLITACGGGGGGDSSAAGSSSPNSTVTPTPTGPVTRAELAGIYDGGTFPVQGFGNFQYFYVYRADGTVTEYEQDPRTTNNCFNVYDYDFEDRGNSVIREIYEPNFSTDYNVTRTSNGFSLTEISTTFNGQTTTPGANNEPETLTRTTRTEASFIPLCPQQ